LQESPASIPLSSTPAAACNLPASQAQRRADGVSTLKLIISLPSQVLTCPGDNSAAAARRP
jgi:hypothetical protein